MTLHEALDITRTEEATRAQLQDLQIVHDKQVRTDVVQIRTQNPTGPRKQHHKVPTKQQVPDDKVRTCSHCGTSHEKDACPAKGSKCLQCGKLNHWKHVCKSRTVQQKVTKRSRM